MARTEAEGPFLRAAVWLQGCSIQCPECCNPELFGATGGVVRRPRDLAEEIASLDVEGVTLLGGEPLDQAGAVVVFLDHLRAIADQGVMLFTGHPFRVVEKEREFRRVMDRCDLVVAGPYVAAAAPDPRRWIGSRNQTIHFITDRYRHLEPGWEPHRTEIEIHIRDDEIIVNGTPHPHFTGEESAWPATPWT